MQIQGVMGNIGERWSSVPGSSESDVLPLNYSASLHALPPRSSTKELRPRAAAHFGSDMIYGIYAAFPRVRTGARADGKSPAIAGKYFSGSRPFEMAGSVQLYLVFRT